MRIAGKELVTVTTVDVPISRPGFDAVLKVSPFSPGLNQKLTKVGLNQTVPAPRKPVMNGPVPFKRADGNVQTYEDDMDPVYTAKMSQVFARKRAVQLANALRNDPTVEFDAKPPATKDPKAWEQYADALLAEICNESTGFFDSEVADILDAAIKGKVEVDTEAAKDQFLGESGESPQGEES